MCFLLREPSSLYRPAARIGRVVEDTGEVIPYLSRALILPVCRQFGGRLTIESRNGVEDDRNTGGRVNVKVVSVLHDFPLSEIRSLLVADLPAGVLRQVEPHLRRQFPQEWAAEMIAEGAP